MDNSQILKDIRRLPAVAVAEKYGISLDDIRKLKGLPPRKKPSGVVLFRPTCRPNRKSFKQEMQSYVDKYNREHGTDFVPLFREVKK
jgi:hypothetical protein